MNIIQHNRVQTSYDTDYYDLNYPGLILKIVLQRKLKYHLIQTYLQSSVFLTISWLALFLPPASIAERLAIAMTILLTLTSMFASERRWDTNILMIFINVD